MLETADVLSIRSLLWRKRFHVIKCSATLDAAPAEYCVTSVHILIFPSADNSFYSVQNRISAILKLFCCNCSEVLLFYVRLPIWLSAVSTSTTITLSFLADPYKPVPGDRYRYEVLAASFC